MSESMTGMDVLKQALSLLGYTNQFGEVATNQNAELVKRGMAALTQIYNDLINLEKPNDYEAYTNMSVQIPLSPRAVTDVMPYGVAMVLAQQDGNGDSYAYFASVYNAKRKATARPNRRIVDVIPRGGY